jgi:hypothetical protein
MHPRASTFFAFSLPGILPLTLVFLPMTGSSPRINEPADGKTFAEEVRNEIRLKIGLNF